MDVKVAFTEEEFEEAVEIQNRQDNQRTAVQLEVQKSPLLERNPNQDQNATVVATAISADEQLIDSNQKHINNDMTSNESPARHPEEEEEERDNSRMSGKQLFGGILSNDAENLKEAREKKMAEKRALIEKIKREKQEILPFVYNPSFIK